MPLQTPVSELCLSAWGKDLFALQHSGQNLEVLGLMPAARSIVGTFGQVMAVSEEASNLLQKIRDMPCLHPPSGPTRALEI